MPDVKQTNGEFTLNKKVSGAVLATAVAGFLLSTPVLAESQSTSSSKVKCAGIHSCKGNSDCKGNGNSKCKGHNKCAPYGWKYTSSEEACKDQGGKVYKR